MTKRNMGEIAGAKCAFCLTPVEDFGGVKVFQSMIPPPPGKPYAYICEACVTKCVGLLKKAGRLLKFPKS